MGGQSLTHSGTSVSAFAERVFACLPGADQRRWAHAYVQGLLTTPGKKSVRRLAATVSDSPAASQSLHQFVNASPWDWHPVRDELSRWGEQQGTPQAVVIDQAILRKRGEHSCGVHRRFLSSTGRSVTCQLGIGAFLTSCASAVPVGWRLLLPGAWATAPRRRQRTRIPAGVGSRSVDQHILDLVDSSAGSPRTAALPVVCHLGSAIRHSAGALVRGLAQRGRDFVVSVPEDLQITASRHLRSARPQSSTRNGQSMTARSLFESTSGTLPQMETVAPRGGVGRRLMTVMSSVVGLSEHGSADAQIHRAYRLFATLPDGGGLARTWLTSLTHTRMESVLALVQLLPRAGETVREMKEGFGLLDFEGRSYPGWRHHMTLVPAAYSYSRFGPHTAMTGERLIAAA
ncbi:transposase [Streptomyces sp. ISL-96]|uniref:IS701 family transposase n=1 Tax=Streptomyces sp. ISL-96 TaxID=2819191 RepID=UPI001BE82F20|nr:transposase [Streptomyces sp. ISL-96]MBT2493437.1 transposase [Streptomyces sp. ISL-96]